MTENKPQPVLARSVQEMCYMPRAFDCLFYPSGFPVKQSSWPIERDGQLVSIRHRIIEYWDYQAGIRPAPSPGDFEVLRQWFIYYFHAPINLHNASNEQLKFTDSLWNIATWDDLKKAENAAFTDFLIEPF